MFLFRSLGVWQKKKLYYVLSFFFFFSSFLGLILSMSVLLFVKSLQNVLARSVNLHLVILE